MPTVVIMWFGIYLIPDAIPVTVVTPLVTLASLVGVWFYLGIGLPVQLKIGKIAGQGVAIMSCNNCYNFLFIHVIITFNTWIFICW